MRSIEYDIYLSRAKAYAECRAGQEDPTAGLPASDRDSIRGKVLEHLARMENNRLARCDAARHRAGRDAGGEYVGSSLVGSEEQERKQPTTWADLVAHVVAQN